MTRDIRFCALPVFIVLAAILLPACNKSDNNPEMPSGTNLAPPTHLQAYSASQTSVGLQWSLSTSESDAAFDHYALSVKDNMGFVVSTQPISKGNSQWIVTGLTEGIVYTFVMRSAGAAGYISPDSASVQWAPARWLTTDSLNGPPIQVYEFNSSAGASGLQFFSASSGSARTQSLLPGNPDRTLSDVYLETNSDNSLSLNSVSVPHVGFPRNTFFSTTSIDATGLDDPETVPPDSRTYTLTSVPIPSSSVSASRILFAYSSTDNRYVRILLMRNLATSNLYYSTSPNRYIKVQISYQDSTGVIYSKYRSQ